jgi:hypothetical protein
MSDDQSTTSSAVSHDIPSNLLLDYKDVMCPVCKEVYVFPRTYECGHTVCETCMYEMDRRDSSSDTHTARIHHCPICRHATLKSWHSRPLSVIVERIASKHPSYAERKAEILKERGDRDGLKYIPKDIDLANTSHTSRLKLALSLYEVLIERLYSAASRGMSHLIIKEKNIVQDIEKVIDLIAAQLFTKHNIYKILITRGECTVYIHKDAFSWRRQYENRSWTNPSGTDEEEDLSSPVASRARRDIHFSSVINSILNRTVTSSSTLPLPPPLPSDVPPPPPHPPPHRPALPGTISRRRR